MVEKVSGIYRIVCVKNGRYYFGSSVNINGRWNGHRYSLRKNTHNNPTMQNVWNKHGEQSFRCEMVELIPKNELFDVEQKYLNEHVGKSNCMNISMDAISPMRGKKLTKAHRKKLSNSGKGRRHSPETREKMSETAKKTPRVWLQGRTLSKETREKIGDSMRGKPKLKLRGRKHPSDCKHCAALRKEEDKNAC